MKKPLSLFLALALAFALCLTGCGGGNSDGDTGSNSDGGDTDKVYTLRFSTHDPETSAIMQHTKAYFDQITEVTDGHVEVEILASAVVASAATVGDMISSGGVDMGWVYTSYYPTQFTLSDVIALPLQGFGDIMVSSNVLWDLYETVPEMAAQWDNEYKVLQLYSNPPMMLMTKDKITSVDQMKALNIRCPSGAITDILAAWGASGISMGPTDIYEAMEKNNIDGYIFEYVGTTSFALQEVTNYYLDMPLYTGAFAIAMNWASWNALPQEYRDAIDAISGREASMASAQVFADAKDKAVATIQEATGSNGQPAEFLTPTDEELAGWKVEADKYAETWAQTITDSGVGVDGAEYLANAQAIAAKYE